jgi:GTP cyclohydrolase I
MKTPVLLPDVAAETDQRGVALHAVGIRGLRLPVLLRTPAETTQQVIAVADLSVDIDAQQRGAHMSRLVETLYEWASEPRAPAEVKALLQTTRDRLNSRSARLQMQFPYFLQVPAPVTRHASACWMWRWNGAVGSTTARPVPSARSCSLR